jgi:hypothetical protein
MKLCILLLSLLMLPALASAEIYKWKDKDGKVRYSDVPPPSNVKQEALYGKKIPKPTGLAPLSEVEGDATAAANKDKAASGKDKAIVDKALTDKNKAPADKSKAPLDKAPLSKEEAAAKRAKDAEQQKIADEAKQAELKLKEDNCKASKSNLATYTNGGRIVKTNEKGEKEYLGDADISQGKTDSQKDVEKYCD